MEPNEAVRVVDPLLDEVPEDAAAHPGQLDLVEDLQQEDGVVVEGCDDDLECERLSRGMETFEIFLPADTLSGAHWSSPPW